MVIHTPSVVAETFYLLVNVKNNFNGDEMAIKSVIKRLYLKQQTKWPNELDARPFSRTEDDPSQRVFVASVLEMSDAELNAHWLKLKQTQGGTPPRAVGSTRILLRTLGKNEGAFGIASETQVSSIPQAVKVLLEFSG